MTSEPHVSDWASEEIFAHNANISENGSQDKHRHYDSFDAGPEWGTPPEIVNTLSKTLVNGFDLDPASGAEPEPYARTRYTVEDDGLSQPWFGNVWLNPPYGREHNPKWGDKTLAEWQSGRVESITALVPASTETTWFQQNYAKADVLTFLDERVNFVGAGSDGASFPSVIATFGLANLPAKYVKALDELGQPYPNTERIIRELLSQGATAPQALDYYFTEFAGMWCTDWAEIRGVNPSTVSRNKSRIGDLTNGEEVRSGGGGDGC